MRDVVQEPLSMNHFRGVANRRERANDLGKDSEKAAFSRSIEMTLALARNSPSLLPSLSRARVGEANRRFT